MTPIRVLVADDQAIVRDGLVTLLGLIDGIEVVGEAVDGEQAVELAVRERPDVVLMDLRMPRLDGAAATARIALEAPGSAVLVLTTFADDESIASALGAGAIGYLTKDAGRAELEVGIRSAAAGLSTLGSSVASRVLAGFTTPASAAATEPPASVGVPPAPTDPTTLRARFPSLTQREAEVLELLAQGRSNGEIASGLYVSPVTVKSHVNALFAKLGARDRADAMARALGL